MSTAGPGDVVRINGQQLPPILAQAGAETWCHIVEYFTAHIRNLNTRAAYGRAVISFFWWCEAHDRHSLRELRPVDIAAYVEEMATHRAAPTVKQHFIGFEIVLTGHGVKLAALFVEPQSDPDNKYSQLMLQSCGKELASSQGSGFFSMR